MGRGLSPYLGHEGYSKHRALDGLLCLEDLKAIKWIELQFTWLCTLSLRGCTSVEQSIIGGCAHLLSFNGSDTMSAGFYAQVSRKG